MSEPSFGRRALDLQSTTELIELEQREGRVDLFSDIDVTVSGLMVRAMRGSRVVELARSDRGDSLRLIDVPESLRTPLQHAFQLESQQSRGAWFLPETVPIKARGVLFAAIFREAPRYAHTLATEERGKLALKANPDAMVVWSVLEPFCELLLAPLFLRVDESGFLTREEFAPRWSALLSSLADVLPFSTELQAFSWGGGWARFAAEQELAAEGSLLTAIAEQLDVNAVRRYRAKITRALIAQYYAKAKNGRAKRKQVITKEHARGLAAFFGGDWLAFVRYLGEEPHEEERIATALPDAKIVVGGKAKAAELALKRGVPLEEAERIVQAFWNAPSGNSPVLERVDLFRTYWTAFDEIHARQATGMPSLWGLVEDGGWATLDTASEKPVDAPYRAKLYEHLLPAAVVNRVEDLWKTSVLPKWPESLVSEPFPHTAMAETFGPALKFWHGCALTAWFVCEGPSSRTDIPGLAEYYRRELIALEDLGCPIQPQLFEQLLQVKLGPEESIWDRGESVGVGHGISLQVGVSHGSRRAGFEKLRDVITPHRRWWAGRYLEQYLRARWEGELRTTARQFHLMTEERGKPPTFKQFSKHTIEPARRWFGGDIALVYASIGEKIGNVTVGRALRMPKDRGDFVARVFAALDGATAGAKSTTTDRQHGLRRLAMESLSYVQLLEALGRSPTLKEFGARFEWPSKAIASDVDEACGVFSANVDQVIGKAA